MSGIVIFPIAQSAFRRENHNNAKSLDVNLLIPEFRAFNAQHLATLGLIATLIALEVWFGRRANARERAWLGRILGFLLLSYAVVIYAQKALASDLSWSYTLPLQLCDWVLIACLISLFFPNQFTSEITYFWGLAGVLQAILTPDIGQGFPSWEFILFFWGHGGTLLSITFIISGQGFRPRRGSIRRALVALNTYGLVAGALDALFHWNYGFLCHKPAEVSLFDYLGPWPWYLISIEIIALVSFLLLDLPWRIVRRRHPRECGPS